MTIESLLIFFLGSDGIRIGGPRPEMRLNAEHAMRQELEQQAFMMNFNPSEDLADHWKKLRWKAEAKSKKIETDNITEKCAQLMREQISQKEFFSKRECAEPAVQPQSCQRSYEVGGYRLADFVNGKASISEWKWMKAMFPHSLCTKIYNMSLRGQNHSYHDGYWALQKLVNSKEYADFEKPDDDVVVVHIRAFDVDGRSEGWQQMNQAYFPNISYSSVARSAKSYGLGKTILVYGDHYKFHHEGSDNGLRTIEKSKQRVAGIRHVFEENGFEVNERMNWNADCDVIFMSHAKFYVHGGGSFSALVGNMVTKNGGYTWEWDRKTKKSYFAKG